MVTLIWVNIGSANGLLSLTNIDLSSEVFCATQMTAISPEVFANLFRHMYSEFELLSLLTHFLRAN